MRRAERRHPAFEAALAEVAGRLDLPQPDRTRVLEEIALDLDDILEGLMQRGLPRDEAAERAVRLLIPSEVSVEALVDLHEPTYRQLTRRFSPGGMKRLERALLYLVAGAGVGPMALALVGSGLLTTPSPLLWAILGTAALILVQAGRKALQLLVERDHTPGTVMDGLGPLLALSCAGLVLGAVGAVREAYSLAASVELAGSADASAVIPWLIDTSVLVSAGLLTALLGGLCWYLLLQKADAVERAHRRADALIQSSIPLGGKGVYP